VTLFALNSFRPNVLQSCPKAQIFRKCPRLTEDCQRLLKKALRCFHHTIASLTAVKERSQVARQAKVYLSICSMRRERVFLLSPEKHARTSQGYPRHNVFLIYTPGWGKVLHVRVVSRPRTQHPGTSALTRRPPRLPLKEFKDEHFQKLYRE